MPARRALHAVRGPTRVPGHRTHGPGTPPAALRGDGRDARPRIRHRRRTARRRQVLREGRRGSRGAAEWPRAGRERVENVVGRGRRGGEGGRALPRRVAAPMRRRWERIVLARGTGRARRVR